MQKKTFLAVAIIGVVAVALAALILGTGGGSTEAVEDTAGAYPRGPHGGRLLSDDGLQVEVTIYEAGVPPVFKVYPLDTAGQPLPPADVTLRIELHRLGGRIDRIAFAPEADYLLGAGVVEEPHSFDVKVFAEYKGRRHEWSYAQVEGKVMLGEDQLRTAGVNPNAARYAGVTSALSLDPDGRLHRSLAWARFRNGVPRVLDAR